MRGLSTAVPLVDLLPRYALGATAFAVVGTPILALLVLRVFRFAVRRSMRSASRAAAKSAATSSTSTSPATALVDDSPPDAATGPPDPRPSAGSLTAVAGNRLRHVVGWYLVAGLSYAALAAVILLSINGQDLLPLHTALLLMVFAWPLVPTLALVHAWSWSATGLAMAGYFGIIAALGLLDQAGAAAALLLWAFYMLPASLVVAAVAPRPLRAVGPFLAPSMFVIGLGLAVWPSSGSAVLTAGVGVDLVEPTAFGLIALVAAATLLVVPLAAWRHKRKAVSDQSVLIDQWWLLFTLVPYLFSAHLGRSALALLLPYLGYLAVVGLGRNRSHRRALRRRPQQLLLLRVFAARSRSERLLHRLSAYWRLVGTVQLIAGTAAAAAPVEPDEFLNFARGVLPRQFVRDETDLAARLQRVDRAPDRDGRFRINRFYCDEDTWRPTVRELARSADVILVDLRGLNAVHQDVAVELELLARLGAIERTVGLVDRSTDRFFLRWVLHSANAPALHTVEMDPRSARPLALLRQLATVAG